MIKQRFKSISAFLSLVFFIMASLAVYTSIQAEEDQPLFTENEYKAHLKFLADDLLEGRAPGTRGGDLAALYIASQFEAAGLQPISEKTGYFQQVPVLSFNTEYESVTFTLSAKDESKELIAVDEVVLYSELLQEEVSMDEDLLFVGYGIEAPEYNWDDFKGIDLEDKILVMLCNEPDYEKTGFGSESLSYYGTWTYKEEIARIKGAKGIIILHTDETVGIPFSPIRNALVGDGCVVFENQINNPLTLYAWISQPAIDETLAFVGLSCDQLREKAESRDFLPIPLGLRAKVSFKQHYRKFSSPNVIGMLSGSSMNDEAIILMAHYDHLGIGPSVEGDNIYNGAYDNASGTAGLICLARAFASQSTKRNIIFLATTLEEKRIRFGSEYYVANPIFPLEKTIIALNMDGLSFKGRQDGVMLFPIQFTDAIPVAKKLSQDLGLELHIGSADKTGRTYLFDNFPFITRDLVALRIKLAGKYLSMTDEEVSDANNKIGMRYHQPRDEIYPFFRYDGNLQALQTIYYIGRYYADGAKKPSMKPDHPFALPKRLRNIRFK